MSGRKGQRNFGSIRRLPSGRYQARYRDRLGTWHAESFYRKADADAYLAEMRTELARGTWRDPRDGRITFAEYAEQWLASDPAKAATTRARDDCVIRTHLVPALGRVPLAEITPRDVQAVISAMTARLAPKTVLTNAGVLRAVLNSAVYEDRLYVSPYRRPKLPAPAPRADRRRLTLDQQRRLADLMPAEYAAMVFVAGVLGLRFSEVVGLRVRDLDLDGHRPVLRVERPLPEVSGRHVSSVGKTAGSRATLTLPRFMVDILRSHLAACGRSTADEHVFQSSRGGPVHGANFRTRIWRPAVQAAGFDGLTFHALRHSASGLMRQVGAHDQVIQQRMRHTHRPTTTDIYGWVPDEADERVNEALDRLYSG